MNTSENLFTLAYLFSQRRRQLNWRCDFHRGPAVCVNGCKLDLSDHQAAGVPAARREPQGGEEDSA